MYKIIINHEPQAKKRHRSKIKRGKIITYDPQKAEKVKTKWNVAAQLREQGILMPLEGPISFSLVSYHQFPKSWSKKRKETEIWKTSKPDLDNICKNYKDILNGIAYKDDAQVVQMFAEKKYSDKPGIVINLKIIGEIEI